MTKERIFTKDDLYKDISVKKERGSYRARIQVSVDTETNKYSYRSIYGASVLEVKARVIDFIQDRLAHQDEQMKNDELFTTDFEKWLYKEKYGTIKPKSFDRIEQVYKNQIEPYVKGLRTKNIKASDCKEILDINLNKGYSYSTLLKIYQVMNGFFNMRVADGSLPKNPMNTVRFYKKEFVHSFQSAVRQERDKAVAKKDKGMDLTPDEEGLAFSKLKMDDDEDIRVLTDEEINKMLDVAYNGYYIRWTTKTGKQAQSGPFVLKQAKYFLFILNTGIRRGEACALKYSDIDFEKKTAAIQRNITTAKKRDKTGRATGGIYSVEGTPKTKGSRAVIPLNNDAVEILKDMLSDEPKGYKGYIANKNGKAIGENALGKRFTNLLRQAGVEHCGMHSLRHTFASKLYEATVGDSKLVSELVRHASVAFTEEIYVHLKEKYKQNRIADFKIYEKKEDG